ncbi:bifunctional 2-dehydro-3-deoxygluconokinase/2-dehydro-3-deoxygalactonokinase [Haloarcula onubensis]|uniref:Sugar kinase n=1 Tax=Haloarcula onubensis TaxID=2950539 RepID=A0ABU2FM21_9EURY|nr:bifunctional 2-dehydro-3-deoxygluconokinase/2-dehydro-3-deoxygalactonokinase [Halomicroarcula sp. S3CR25-11]MDS0281802.1 sugar kinase [Halomicroarcula sp. S3CR25-11]
MSDLVTFGETMLRLSPPDEERLELADQYDVNVAGAESNVAVAAQRLGVDSAWLSKLPDSPVGRKVVGDLRSHGIAVDVVWDDSPEARQGTYYFERGRPPRGSEVIYDRAHASVTTATADELPTAVLAEADCFHTTGITPALSETLAATTAELLRLAQSAGTTTSFDVNFRSNLWSPAAAKDVLTDLFPDIDLLVVAERDARVVLDAEGDAETIARELDEAYGFEAVVLTRGSDGALALADGEVFTQPTYEAADAYPVGTGDSFVGGFLSRYLDGEPVPEALAWGAATAALKRSVPGDMATVSPAEVREVIGGTTESLSR